MKIVHITSAYRPYAVGGAEVVVSNLSEAQAEQGHDVHVIHLSPVEADYYVENGVTIHPYKPVYLAGPKEHVSKPKWFRTINKIQMAVNPFFIAHVKEKLKLIKPDILHTHSLPDVSSLIWGTAKQLGIKTVHTLHDYDLLCGRATLYRDGNCAQLHTDCKLHKKMKTFSFHNVDRIVSISEKVIERHRTFGVLDDRHLPRTSVIWNAAPLVHSGETSIPRPAGGAVKFGFIGRLVPEKGVGFLIEACRKLPAEGWSLDIAGRAPVSDSVFRKAAEGLPVQFLGWVDSSSFMRSIDVLIVPSLWDEPFGLTTIEGLANSLPVIGSNRGAIPEILQDFSPDMIFDADRMETLTEIMARMLKDYSSTVADEEKLAILMDKLKIETMRDDYQKVYEN